MIKADVYISKKTKKQKKNKKKRRVYIAFKKSVSNYDCFDKILEFISEFYFFEGYELICPRLITSLKWHFDYLIFKKEKGRNRSCTG